MGFNDFATDNLWQLISDQKEATGTVPTDTTFIVERFRDELGDWRVILHSPYGLRVHGPLALAVARRLRERYGIDEKPTASDDGIIVRLPDTEDTPPGAELFVFDADEIDPIVTDEVGGSALFASRFRECAARALLLPRRHPGKRSPLWHQRQRAAQLLDIARKYPDFPIVLETVRECLQDVYDVPMLRELMSRLAQRRIRIIEVETATPSPFAASLLFGYVGAFMYEGDSPLAERRAAALSLDSTLLAELLGRVELRELLDQQVIASTVAQLQHLTEDRAVRDAEGVADLLRLLGPLTESEVAQRSTVDDVGGWLEGLRAARRALTVSFAGQTWWVAIEDVGLLRDGVGIAVPVGIPASFTESVADPLGELLGRYARTRGPFTSQEAAERFGLGLRVTADVLGRMSADRRLVRGEFTAVEDTEQWCDADVLKILRRRSLAALRAQVEPVSTAAYARFLPAWQQVGVEKSSGIDGLASVIEQLSGVPIPASAIEPLVFGQRVRNYQPAMLDELLASGEVTWSGAGSIGSGDGWIAFHSAETAPLTLAMPAEIDLTDVHRDILATLEHGGAYFFRQLTQNANSGDAGSATKNALWELIWAGHVTGDTFAPVRALLAGSGRRGGAHRQRQRPPRLSRYSVAHAQTRTTDATVAGRWSALAARGARFHHPGALLGGAAPQSLWRAHQGLGRGGARRVRDVVQGAHGAGGRRSMSAWLLRRIPRWRPVRGRIHRRPAAHLSRRAGSGTSRLPRGGARGRGSRQPLRRCAAVAHRLRDRAPAGAQGGRAGGARRRRTDVVPRARRPLAVVLLVGCRRARRGRSGIGRPRRRGPPAVAARRADQRRCRSGPRRRRRTRCRSGRFDR